MHSALLLLFVVGSAGQAAPPAPADPTSQSTESEKSQGSENLDDQIARLRQGLKAEQGTDRLKTLVRFSRFIRKRQLPYPVGVVKDLLPLLDDPDARVKQYSIDLMGEFSDGADQIVPVLDGRLKKTENVRGADGQSSDPDRDGFIRTMGELTKASPAAVEIVGALFIADAELANLPGLKTPPKPGAKPLSKQDEAAIRETTAAARGELALVLYSLAQSPRLSVKYLPALLAVIDDKTVSGRELAMLCITKVDDVGSHVQATKALKAIRDNEKSAAADFALRKIKEATDAKANAARGGK